MSHQTVPAQGGALVSPLRWPASVSLPFWSHAHVPYCRTVAALSVFVLCVTRSGRQRGRRSLGRLFFGDGHFHIISYSERGRTFIGFARWFYSFHPLPLTRLFSRQDFFPPDPHSIHSPLAFISSILLTHPVLALLCGFVFFFCVRLQAVYRQKKFIACSIIIAKIA